MTNFIVLHRKDNGHELVCAVDNILYVFVDSQNVTAIAFIYSTVEVTEDIDYVKSLLKSCCKGR